MKRYFVVGDVHGYFKEMMDSLTQAGFDRDNPNHIFVSLGDLLDRGWQPSECLKFVLSLDRNRRILIRGNHETLMENMIARGYALSHDIRNGTVGTAVILTDSQDFCNGMRYHKDYNDYIKECDWWYATKTHVFVHGWVPMHCRSVEDLNDSSILAHIADENDTDGFDTSSVNCIMGVWNECSWYNGMEMWKAGNKLSDRTVVCGHWHCSFGNSNYHGVGEEFGKNADFSPFIDDGIVAIDACTAYSHEVNCYVFDEEE